MKLVVSGLVAVCAATIVALLCGMFLGGLNPLVAQGSLELGFAAGCGAWISMRNLSKGEPVRSLAAWSVIFVFSLFAFRAFCWLIYTRGKNIMFISPNNFGDLALHITFIRYLASGVPFWPDNPIFASVPLHYPFGIDLFNSLLTLAHMDLSRGLVCVGLLGAIATGVMLLRWGGAFTMAGFLFNGGLAGFAILKTHELLDYQADLDWKSIPLALFVTQRGLLYAIPAGLALLWSWRARLLEGNRGMPIWIEVLLYATMPLFHLHTFLFLSAMLACWMIVPKAKEIPSPRGAIMKLGVLSFLPASALIWMMTGGFQSGNTIHFVNAWMGEKDHPFLFWVNNFGFLSLVVCALFAWLWLNINNPKTLALAAIAIPAAILFRVVFFVMFATWDWDNTKLMLWCYLALLPVIWAMVREWPAWLRAVTCCALFFSGAVSLIGGLNMGQGGYTMASREELDDLTTPLKKIPPTATFACSPIHNHPLLLLGRKVVAGYDGHLFSHGIDYLGNNTLLEKLLRGEPGWQDDARLLNADYLFWGSREQERYGDRAPWRACAPTVYSGSWGTIYDLRNILLPTKRQ